jgi:uncharacterized membrane protein YfcA
LCTKNNMNEFWDLPENLRVALGLPLFAVALYLWVQGVRHMIGMLRNIRVNRWVAHAFGPLAFFAPFLFGLKGPGWGLKEIKGARLD